MTPTVARVETELRTLYPDLPRFGVTNCRPIARSTTWSQHSWSNAADIYSPHLPRIRVNPRHMNYLDRIYTYLITHRQRLGIRVILWRTRDHWNHIHIDCWPKGHGVPPCAGGKLQVLYPDNRRGDTFTLHPPEPQEEEEDDMFCAYGDENQTVLYWQRLLNYLGHRVAGTGKYDDATRSAVSEFMTENYGPNPGNDIQAIEATTIHLAAWAKAD